MVLLLDQYEEPAPQSSSEEVSTFYENMFDSLDIGLVLFEVAYGEPSLRHLMR